jgi:DNA-binding HxlR family transcriptional regulator
VSTRSYGQLCGLARSLDLLGERWTLLVVRELLLGPKRFGALQDALPGISTNLLSARLQALVAAGAVEQVRLPHPSDVSAYALTPRGEDLRGAVEGLAVWGLDLLRPEAQLRRGDLARGSWLASALAASAGQRDTGERLTANFDVDGDRFAISLAEGRAHVRHGVADMPDAELRCTLPAFLRLARGQARAGDPHLRTVFEALRA